jgi:hypothetical protein
VAALIVAGRLYVKNRAWNLKKSEKLFGHQYNVKERERERKRERMQVGRTDVVSA